jgi:superfamily II DNA or RNA helicase
VKLEELVPGARVRGLISEPVEVVKAEWLGADYVTVTYRGHGGEIEQRLVARDDEASLEPDRPRAGISTPDDVRGWKLGIEAMRIRHAGLIDPMLAVSSSTLRPLPHQIKAVYGELLPRTPLRYLLADDPGAGKTIMCGLYVKELLLRGDLQRCLVVAPGGLVDQWADELWEKFRLRFRVLTRELITTTVGGSVFEDHPLLIARMDMLARNEELQDLLEKSEWDLVVVDEAHRMSARLAGREMETTKRYGLGRLLGGITRNFLLMTATPHSGDPAAFQAFLALLDQDRFAGANKGVAAPGTDLMRRMLKEELLTMEGKPLFPQRLASTVRYALSSDEQRLYEAVSDYVRHEMNRADRLRHSGDRRGNTVGFALTVLQRRLASSPEAILRSLERRRDRLVRLRDDLAASGQTSVPQADEISGVPVPSNPDVEDPDRDEAVVEEAEEVLADAASAATTLAELDAEVQSLAVLVDLAAHVRRQAQDSKWLELRSILDGDPVHGLGGGSNRKFIVFSEHRDTLRYLVERISALPGRADSVVEIHGGLSRPRRAEVQRRFQQDPGTTVLVATDAAGEGLNLQCAHLMVNYDLPWNPNRIEQRFGRIHRIGQTEVCHLWNLVADGTREGDVFRRLLDKMQEQSKAYQGKVFDVLGEAFEGEPLRDLLVKAVRYGDDPEVRRQLDVVIDDRVGKGIPELVQRRALHAEVLQGVDLDDARERVDTGMRSKLQPHFVSSWFESSLKDAGGRVRRRADGLFEVGLVPDDVRSAARQRNGAVLRSRYDVVSLDPESAASGPLDSTVELVAAGHPLLESLADVAEQRVQHLLRDGVVLVDDTSVGSAPRVFCAVMHEVVDGHARPHTVSRRVALAEVEPGGTSREVGPAYLDYRPATDDETAALATVLAASPHREALDKVAVEWAMAHLVPEHLAKVRETHAVAVERARVDVEQRLGSEVAFWKNKASRAGSGTDPQASRRLAEAEGRRAKRMRDLEADGKVVPRPPRVLACALVVPSHLLVAGATEARDEATTPRLARAVHAVARAEASLGHQVYEPSTGLTCIRSVQPDGLSRWVDVLVEPLSSRSVTVSRSQLMQARNLGERYRLALVRTPPTGEGAELRYAHDPFRRVRDGGLDQHAFELPWASLWRSAVEPT